VKKRGHEEDQKREMRQDKKKREKETKKGVTSDEQSLAER